jgi:threonylcarbamoyladenosine tRNA methylthiotransferase MtaB
VQVYLKSVGCRLNEAELESWARAFKSGDHSIVNEVDNADLLVFNTCAVTGEAARKSRQLIRRLHRENPFAKLVVSGCYASLDAQQAISALGADLVVGNTDKDRLVEIAMRDLELPNMPAAATAPGESSLFARGRQRAFVKVQDGCRYRCTFCVVTLARGEEHSRSIAEIVAEINGLHAEGIQEVVLTGVHLGGYGSDLGATLCELINAILQDSDIPRLRLASLEPWDLPDDFFKLFHNARLMPHLHLPLQSGSDSVLKRMARRCKTADFAALVDRARAQITDFNVTTDIIVGFPGETHAEWEQTLGFVESIGFGQLHIFTYSPREGTKAARLPDQLSAKVKKQRSQELHALGETLKRHAQEALVGESFAVLWESQRPPSGNHAFCCWGYTPNMFRVATEANDPERIVNTITQARPVTFHASGQYLLAEIV